MTAREPLFTQDGSYSATEVRAMIAALFGARWGTDLAPQAAPLLSAGGGHGVVGATDLLVAAHGTPNMTVDVAAGMAIIRGTQQGDQGCYIGANDATYSVTIAAADATNPRKDLIVAYIEDTDYGAGASQLTIEARAGTPAGSPTEPTPPENSLVLAMVDVPATDTAISSGQITDRRTRAAALGGTQVCASSATYPNPATAGMRVFDVALGAFLYYSGSAWLRESPAFGAATGTTDGSGALTITHGVGYQPVRVTMQVVGSGSPASVTSAVLSGVNSSILSVILYNSTTGAALASTAYTLWWTAW